MTKAEVILPSAVSSVPTARHFVESILTGWGRTDLAWTATLLVSELAANAALHARGEQFTVRIQLEGDGVRLEVSDSSLRPPRQRSYAEDATTGRGLRLVADLSDAWGVTPSTSGKTVWVTLHAPDAVGEPTDEFDVEALLEAFADEGGQSASLSDLRDRPTAVALGALGVAA
jgi:anti-sigma regulatory factor (Ser/Thr protein kinase)